MLFTRCPDCDTTFRVTDDALKKAHGQVRCGRCASVFNAYAELREPPSDGAATQDEPRAAGSGTASAPQREAAAQSPPQHGAAAPSLPPHQSKAADAASPASRATEAAPPRAAVAPPPAAAPQREIAGSELRPTATGERVVFTVADVVAQVGLIADEDAETGEMEADSAALAHADAMSAEQVNSVLDDPVETGSAPWPLSARPRRSSRWWGLAALLGAAALGAQAIHHFRADLVRYAVVGPIVKDAYAMLGTRVLPRFDVHQYQILDWVATAEPNTRGQGSLKITARIQNRAQQSQPYPSVLVQLKDRWEAAVGSRVFAPTEYGARARGLMAPGETARAEIEVVDPGPDAYGFELDVCIEVETDVISCGADKVFL
ncbi:MAG TPA: zinc-ribbon and DUF3426 domain-containing protein [Gammaproteobacteria bacterium]|nr:zinc-ribbon and DUF3426 domain-containing protein [Gammaproteobacteria bacterium]